MATINANINITNDVASGSVSITQPMTLYKAGGTEGMDTMTSVSKVLTSTNQVDLVTAASVSTSHNYVYISNPSTVSTEYFTVGIGNGTMAVDNRVIYTAKGLRVGLFEDTSSF